jgi:hypothetical protein
MSKIIAQAPARISLNQTCLICGTKFHLKASAVKKGHGKYCSKDCKHIAMRGKHIGREFQKGLVPWNKGVKGIHLNPDGEFKKGRHYSESTEFKRKGVLLGYHGLHGWIEKKLGKAKWQICSCGRPAAEWANLSFRYMKRIKDWQAMCRSCHKKYDKEFGWGKATQKFPELRRAVILP